MSDTTANSVPQDARLAARYLEPGTIVHLYGIPVRLVLGVNVETTEGNLKIIDEGEVGAAIGAERERNPILPLSAQLPAVAPPPPYVAAAVAPKPISKDDYLKAFK